MRAPLDESDLVLRDCDAEDHQSVKHRVAARPGAALSAIRRLCASSIAESSSEQQKTDSTKRASSPQLHRLHRVGENTAILGCARRLAYATKTLCDTGSTVKVWAP